MKCTFNISGHPVAFTLCTAIAVGISPDRQPALFVHDELDEFGDGDGVIFGINELPESSEDAASLLQEYMETDSETLSTVQF